MMYSQGLRLFYNRGLHLLLAKPAVSAVALTQQRAQAFSVYNFQMVFIFNSYFISIERILICKEVKGRQEKCCWYFIRC